MAPSLGGVDRPLYGVALLGEALSEDESIYGKPFVGKAGHRLTRLIEWAGFDRSGFDIYNAAWCRPPDNQLEGTNFESGAISHCKTAHWGHLLSRSNVVVPMGNVPTNALIGRKGILSIRGYVHDGPGYHVIPTVHPSFIQRGQAKWSSAFINDLQKAVELARNGLPIEPINYTLDPSPEEAYRWGQAYRAFRANNPRVKLSFDIETPGKGEDEEELDGEDASYHIQRIGFSYRSFEAMSIPWDPSYQAAIRTCLEGDGEKIVWNEGFDVPRIRASGINIGGLIHDGMIMWHVLHSDLPKKLGFVATYTCPWQPAWKHLSHARPAYYNAVDADVEYRSVEVIESDLKESGLWDVYERDVVRLAPVLAHMHSMGMPIDKGIRSARSRQLADRIRDIKASLEALTPDAARRIEHVFVNTPKDTTGLRSRPSTRVVNVCSVCGIERPRKDHFKRFVKKVNPCCDGRAEPRTVEVTEYYRFSEFTPSRDQLIRYQQVLGRMIPTKWDKKTKTQKVSMDEKALKKLIGKYPDDPYYKLKLEYQELDKLAGTYIGRPVDAEV